MTEPSFPVQVIRGMTVVAAPQEIDITNAGVLRAALLRAAAPTRADLVVDMPGPGSATRPGRMPFSARTNEPGPKAGRSGWSSPARRSAASWPSPPWTV